MEQWSPLLNPLTEMIDLQAYCLHGSDDDDDDVNAIFSKVGRSASEEVVLQLISSKCIPVLLYGLEACPLNKSDNNSLDFAVNRFLMKLFCTTNIEMITECRHFLISNYRVKFYQLELAIL